MKRHLTLVFVGWAALLVAPLFGAEAMRAHFINVGQADSILLEFPCGAVLIDAGAQGEKHKEHLIEYLDSFFTKRTDLNRTPDVIFVNLRINNRSAGHLPAGLSVVFENATG